MQGHQKVQYLIKFKQHIWQHITNFVVLFINIDTVVLLTPEGMPCLARRRARRLNYVMIPLSTEFVVKLILDCIYNSFSNTLIHTDIWPYCISGGNKAYLGWLWHPQLVQLFFNDDLTIKRIKDSNSPNQSWISDADWASVFRHLWQSTSHKMHAVIRNAGRNMAQSRGTSVLKHTINKNYSTIKQLAR